MLLTVLDILKLLLMAFELVCIAFMAYILWGIKHGK